MSWQFETDPEFAMGYQASRRAGRRQPETRLRMRSQISRVVPSPGIG